MSSAVPLVRVIRSGLEESVHLGDVAVCDERGRLLAWAGEPQRPVFARSCMKPLQAAVSLRAIGDDVPARELATMCSSHNGEPIHLSAVRSLLRRAGVPPSALRCPPAYPLDARSMARAVHRRRELSNCSGKHAGMLLACARSGWDLDSYPRPGHPLQRRVLRGVLLATGLDAVTIGTDGCGVPVHGMPLASMAILYARLGRPETLDGLSGHAALCIDAMLAEPYLVGGRDRVDTAVMKVTGTVVVKGGAEALYCASAPRAGLGIAVKIADGGSRAGGAALVRALERAGTLTAAELDALDAYARPPVMGGEGRVGELVADFDLRGSRQRSRA